MSENEVICGTTTFKNGKFIHDDGIKKIHRMLREMKLLFGSGETPEGYFYFHPQNSTFWQILEFQNGHTELRRVSREFIENNFPMVNCDRFLDFK